MKNNKNKFETDGEIFPHGNYSLKINIGGAYNDPNYDHYKSIENILLRIPMDKLDKVEFGEWCNNPYDIRKIQTLLVCEHRIRDVITYGGMKYNNRELWSYIEYTPPAIIEYLMRKIGIWEGMKYKHTNSNLVHNILILSTEGLKNKGYATNNCKKGGLFTDNNLVRKIKLSINNKLEFSTLVKTDYTDNWLYSIGEDGIIIEYLMKKIGIWQ